MNSPNRLMPIAHLPTLLLVIGYPFFWLEMYVFRAPQGIASPLAWCLFGVGVLLVLFFNFEILKERLRDFGLDLHRQDNTTRILIKMSLVVMLFILACVLYASLLPPHLIQESDIFTYHYTLPRQHFILGSFAHIPWSADDLFLLPIDAALSPFWFATVLPNKFPQFIFLVGIIGITIRLTRRFSNNSVVSVSLVLTALMGSHGIGIQMGTAMMDLVVCYLALACLDGFLSRSKIFFVPAIIFFVCSKPLAPFQILVLIVSCYMCWVVLRSFGFKSNKWDFQHSIIEQEWNTQVMFLKKSWGWSVIGIFLVAGPFIAKSIYYAGTPLFPLCPGVVMGFIDKGSLAFQSIVRSSDYLINSINAGENHSLGEFIKHFWLLAVPSQGVNNIFDYPLGLPYLLCLGPFIFSIYRAMRKKEFVWIPLVVVLFWLSWWWGAREARHLYVPLLMIFLTILPRWAKPAKVLMACLFLALLMNAISIYRAHQVDFGLWGQDVLRDKDKRVLLLNELYRKQERFDPLDIDNIDAPFAQFPLSTHQEKLPHLLAF